MVCLGALVADNVNPSDSVEETTGTWMECDDNVLLVVAVLVLV